MTTEIPAVDDPQRAFLRAVYERYHADSAWPTMKELHRELTVNGHLDIYQAGQQIDPHYLLPHVDGRGGVALRLLEVGFPGLAALRMSPTAAELPSGSKAVGAVGQWYPLNNTSSR